MTLDACSGAACHVPLNLFLHHHPDISQHGQRVSNHEGAQRRYALIFIIRFLTHSRAPAYKNKGAFKEEDRRNRRNEQQVEIRRQKRDENIAKRRNFLPSAGPDSDEEVGGGAWDPPVCALFFRAQLSLTPLLACSGHDRWRVL